MIKYTLVNNCLKKISHPPLNRRPKASIFCHPIEYELGENFRSAIRKKLKANFLYTEYSVSTFLIPPYMRSSSVHNLCACA